MGTLQCSRFPFSGSSLHRSNNPYMVSHVVVHTRSMCSLTSSLTPSISNLCRASPPAFGLAVSFRPSWTGSKGVTSLTSTYLASLSRALVNPRDVSDRTSPSASWMSGLASASARNTTLTLSNVDNRLEPTARRWTPPPDTTSPLDPLIGVLTAVITA